MNNQQPGHHSDPARPPLQTMVNKKEAQVQTDLKIKKKDDSSGSLSIDEDLKQCSQVIYNSLQKVENNKRQ